MVCISSIPAMKNVSKYTIPFCQSSVMAGFPSPAQDYIEERVNILNKIVKNPSSTFLVRTKGNSMEEKGIQDGDILVVDKSLQAKNNSVVIAYIDGEFTVKRFFQDKKGITLYPANSMYKPIKVNPESDFLVWGVVTFVIHEYK